MSESISASVETQTLGTWLDQLVERMADPAERAEMVTKYGDRWSLCLCYDDKDPKGSWAETRCKTAQGNLVLESFGHKPRSNDKMHRICELPLRAILVCGELFEDSKAKMAARS